VSSLAELDAFQRDFAAALRGQPACSPAGAALAAQPAFAVYRNTVLRGGIDALVANHPTVRQLVGDEWIEAAAAAFFDVVPPRDGSLAGYGEGFADFLDRFAPAAELPYLAGVARLDRAWTEAHLAADAPVLGATALAATPPERLLQAVLVPHPAARWLRFAEHPSFTIWRRHREGQALDAELAWHGEAALVLRPGLGVEWRDADPAALDFLDACAEGLPFAEAAGRIADDAPGPETWLGGLLAAGAFCRIDIAPGERS